MMDHGVVIEQLVASRNDEEGRRLGKRAELDRSWEDRANRNQHVFLDFHCCEPNQQTSIFVCKLKPLGTRNVKLIEWQDHNVDVL